MSGEIPPATLDEPAETPVALLPLTPRYNESKHSVYVDAVVGALVASRKLRWWQLFAWTQRVINRAKADDSRGLRSWRFQAPGEAIRNIALTGGYGVGKSSILQEVARRNRRKVLQISLSTLSPEGSSSLKASTLVDSKSSNESRVSGDNQLNPVTSTKTNQIQKEIVKQLLYREEPAKMPGSRFKRIGRFQFWRAVSISVIFGLFATLASYLAGWTTQLGAEESLGNLELWLHAVVFSVAFLAVLSILFLNHNRFQIRQVKVAKAEIALTSDAVNYFDRYLDEIVYFFEVTKRDVVIFEDIDRFDDPHIFETLRALNTLLNGAGQLHRRHIRFIYAIKDSIFIKLGDVANETVSVPSERGVSKTQDDLNSEELERANRTKFFDLVVPVVPFISHRNARNLMDEVLRDINGKIDPKLIDLAARHITDMRLIKNVRNEFVIFKSKVLKADDGGELKLSDNALLAMMLYKNIHLDDFEKIKPGTSKLDNLRRASLEIIAHCQSQLSADSQQVRRQLADLTIADQRSKQLAESLETYASRLGRHISVSSTAIPRFYLGGVDRTHEIGAPTFWNDFASVTDSLQVNFQEPSSGTIRAQLQITKEDAVAVFGAEVSSGVAWDEANRDELSKQLQSIERNREVLAAIDWDYLYKNNQFVDDSGKSLAVHAEALESSLARELVAGGFLGRDFALYTSTYYAGRVSSNAQNFLMHNVERNVLEPLFALSADEVDAIISDRGDSILRDHGMYNVNVLDRLLVENVEADKGADQEKRSAQADILIESLATENADAQLFLDMYLVHGEEKLALVRRLASRWGEIFKFITTREELDLEQRLLLFDAALAGASGEVVYQVGDNGTRAFIEVNIANLPILTTLALEAPEGDRLAQLLISAGVRVNELSVLSEALRRAVIENSGYKVSRVNLELAIGEENLALDNIRKRDPKIYQYVLDNLESYLEDLRTHRNDAVTIESSYDVASILSNVAEKPELLIARLLDMADPRVQISYISEVPQSIWVALASKQQFPANFSNITSYINTVEGIDSNLALILESAGEVSGLTGISEEDKVALGATILGASNVLPAPELRVKLIVGLGLSSGLPLSKVPSESGRLLGLLVEKKVVPDDEETFALALKQDWKSREFLISRSQAFYDFMTPTQVPLADVAPMMASPLVSIKIKDEVLAQADDYVVSDHRAAMESLATHALSGKDSMKLPIALVSRMATAGVDASQIVQLLVPILVELPVAQLSIILTTMGAPYAKAAIQIGSRPRFPNTKADFALANRLKDLDVARTVTRTDKHIIVNMRNADRS